MVKQHSQLMHICLGTCDLAAIVAAYFLSYEVRFHFFSHADYPRRWTVISNLSVTLCLSLLVMAGSGLYRPQRDKSFLLELGKIIKATFITWCILIVILYFTNNTPFTRVMLGIFLPAMMAALTVERGLFRSALRYIRQRGWNLRHALIIGTGRLGQSTLHRLRNNSWTGLRVTGFIDADISAVGTFIRDVPVIGTLEQTLAVVEASEVDCVFIALPSENARELRMVIDQLEQTAVDVRIVPDLFLSRFPINLSVGELDGMPIISIRENPLAGWPGIYKRAFDIFGAAFGLILCGLPMMVIAIFIKFSSPGPVIFRQKRISFGGKPFSMLKFRTMHKSAEHESGPQFALPNDPRCTRIGKWLRSSSLDELPQLWNVLIGHMSLVGPRPERPEMLQKIRAEIPGFPMRLKVRAGLTGWAQINGFRGRTSFRKRLQYDLYYLNNWSPLLDLQIVFATIFRGFRHPNAY